MSLWTLLSNMKGYKMEITCPLENWHVFGRQKIKTKIQNTKHKTSMIGVWRKRKLVRFERIRDLHVPLGIEAGTEGTHWWGRVCIETSKAETDNLIQMTWLERKLYGERQWEIGPWVANMLGEEFILDIVTAASHLGEGMPEAAS